MCIHSFVLLTNLVLLLSERASVLIIITLVMLTAWHLLAECAIPISRVQSFKTTVSALPTQSLTRSDTRIIIFCASTWRDN